MWINVTWLLILVIKTIAETHGSTENDGAGDGDSTSSSRLEMIADNQRLLESIPKPYEIIYPLQLSGSSYSAVSTWQRRGRKVVHIERVSFTFDIFGRKQRLQVQLNKHLLSPEVRWKYEAEDKSSIISENVDNCYYQGHVLGYNESRVSLSTCDGLKGLIEFENSTFIVQPLRGASLGINRPHVLYPATSSTRRGCAVSVNRWLSYRDLHQQEYLRRAKQANTQTNGKQDGVQWRVVEMAVIIDNAMFTLKNTSEELEVLDEILYIINMADMFYQSLGINLTVVYVEMWNVADKMDVTSSDLSIILQQLVTYKKSATYQLQHDNTQLFSAYESTSDQAGLAIPESICTDRSIGVNKIVSLYEPLVQATTLVHMLAHNLGVHHDSPECQCGSKFGCVMEEVVVDRGDEHMQQFSSCSRHALDHVIAVGLADCLLPTNPDPQQQVSYQSVCGNGIVERGEQCDCITLQAADFQDCLLRDPCCDPQTCLLYPWAVCNNGPCCNNCTFERFKMCRPSSNECDVPEFCTGLSGHCPGDSHAQDGSPCALGRGYCYDGRCPTHQAQCRQIWGKGAVMGEHSCYERFNTLGSVNGHCGPNTTTHLYNKCGKSDVFCGLLHCVGGESVPLIGAHDIYTKMAVSVAGYEFQCNILNSASIPAFPQTGVVADGTKCGERHICLRHTCTHLLSVQRGRCPSSDPDLICSGHGICTNKLRCYCSPFWTGADCAAMMPIPTRSSPPIIYKPIINFIDTDNNTTYSIGVRPTEHGGQTEIHVKVDAESISTKTLMIILGSVAGAVMVLLVFVMLCYRRSTTAYQLPYSPPWAKKKLPHHHPSAPHSISSDEGVQTPRIIKFGNMPSYREEKYRELRDRVMRIKQGLRSDGNATDDEMEKRYSHASQDSATSHSHNRRPKRGILKKQDGRRNETESNVPTKSKEDSDSDNMSDSRPGHPRIRNLDDLIKQIERQVNAPESGAGEARCDYKHSQIQTDDADVVPFLADTCHVPFLADTYHVESEEGRADHVTSRVSEYPLRARLSIYVAPPTELKLGPATPAPSTGQSGTSAGEELGGSQQTGFDHSIVQVAPQSGSVLDHERCVSKPPDGAGKPRGKKQFTSSGSETSLKSSSSAGSQRKTKPKKKSSHERSVPPAITEIRETVGASPVQGRREIGEPRVPTNGPPAEGPWLPTPRSDKSDQDFKPNLLPLSTSPELSKSPAYVKKVYTAPRDLPRDPARDAHTRVYLAEAEDIDDLNDLSPDTNLVDYYSSDTSPNDPPSARPPFRPKKC